jgi:hypothetical protein
LESRDFEPGGETHEETDPVRRPRRVRLGTQAATAAEFYIVRDATTKKCTVVDSKPTTTTTTVVGNGVYKTKVEAESAVKTTKVCTEQ